MKRLAFRIRNRRRGVIVVLTATLLIVLLAMIAFAVDVGFLNLARTQLQAAADAAALAGAAALSDNATVVEAQKIADANFVAGRSVQLNSSDVVTGAWDANTRSFTPSTSAINAVKVTVRTDAASGGPTALFFARVLGLTSVDESASAIASLNPRDIAFVVDLSGSMNDDTEPTSSSSNSALLQQVFNDFNFGAYPGTSQAFGAPLEVSSSYSNMYSAWGPLHTKLPTSSAYYIAGTDTLSTRVEKACSWIMNVQMPAIMPNAIPAPDSANAVSRGYWASYFTFCDNNGLQLGYRSYTQFMMYNGRDGTPYSTDYTPLSLQSNLCSCPMHPESINGITFSFPPREMPTHAMRRALISAIQVIQNRNQSITDVNQRDWVSIITFDKLSSASPKLEQPLTSDYMSAMTACTRLQAVSSNTLSTCTEAGMNLAYNHIKMPSQGGVGREHTNKIVVLLTDGQPNLKQSSGTTISNYINNHPSTWTNPITGQTVNNWVASGSYSTEKNAALMQTAMMQRDNWYIYSAGVGLECDSDFMDRLGRMGGTADNQGHAPSGGGDPTTYEANVTQIFNDIIISPKLRLVQ
jgi:Flp pilus assembly protein TadG